MDVGGARVGLARWAPAAVVAIVLLHAHLGVNAACRYAALPWCAPVPATADYVGSRGFHLATALSVAVGAAAAAVAAAIVVPALAARWPGAGSAERVGGRSVHPIAVWGRALAIEAVFVAVALPGFAIAGWLAVRRGSFGPGSADWAAVSQAQTIYLAVTSIALAPLHALWLAKALGADQPVGAALRGAAAALARWPAAVGGPLVVLALLRPDHLVALATLAGRDDLVYAVLAHPIGPPVVTLAYAALVVAGWAVAVGLARQAEPLGAPAS